ncbi:MAG TPA: hypothetical protein VF799_02355 [Geobacteraceae bacterium]
MKMKTGIAIAIIVLLSVAFVLLAAYGIREHGAATPQEARNRLLQRELQKADAMADDGAALATLKKLSPALPEIQLRIVQREWRMALQLMQYMQRARENSELANETDAYAGRLRTLLDEMVERCGATLVDAASLSPAIVWQLYNTAASAKVMTAFVMLETEQNVDKVQSVMRDALTDYKAAIEAVDKAGAPAAQRNIPRWNFEVLTGEENVRKFDVSMSDSDKSQALKENLETIIPEIGGYGPGEPVETIVKK